MSQVPVVWEFLEVIPNDLPGIPLERETNFYIELLPDSHPISILSYQMAPAESKEKKVNSKIY